MRSRSSFGAAAMAAIVAGLGLASSGGATPAAEKSASAPAQNGRIAFSSDRNGPDQDLFVMASDGSNQFDLTLGSPEQEVDPSFSPDGKKILYARSDGGDFDVFTINAGGSNPVNLTGSSTGTDTTPAYSPDGRRIAFARDADPTPGVNLDLFVARADGAKAVNLTKDRTTTQEGSPDFSPDGKRIIFSTFDGGDFDYFVMGVDGSNPVNLTAGNPSNDHDGAFSPDGKRIALARDVDPTAGENYDIVLVNSADGSNPS